jgi:hypothetical protein
VTTWSIFPATNGPNAATAFVGGYVAGLMWQVTQPALWVYGYRAWCCNSGQATTPVKCALWNPLSSTGGDGALIPGSAVTTGTLTPGTWNTVLLPAPIPVSLGTPYLTAIAYDGAFPFTVSQFGPAQPHASGIVNGPLVCYSDSAGGATVNASPYTLPQGSFTIAVSDPALAMPSVGNNSFNSWVDVIISDQPPAGFTGPYRLWPNKFDASPATQQDTNLPFNLAHQVNLSQQCRTSWVWFYSFSTSASLPTCATIYRISDQVVVAANTSPSWLKPDGSGAATLGGGWCKAALVTTLPAGQYKVSVFDANGAGGGWSAREFGYWLTGAGASGISWGPLTSPAQGAAASAYVFQPNGLSTPPWTDGHTQQPQNGTFAHDSNIYPYLGVIDGQSSGAPPGAVAETFWVDLEVTPLPSTGGQGIPDLSDRPFRRKLWL